MKKMPEDSSFYTCVPKTVIRWCTVREMWCATDVLMTDGQTDGQMDGQTDGRTEKVTYRGGCPT